MGDVTADATDDVDDIDSNERVRERKKRFRVFNDAAGAKWLGEVGILATDEPPLVYPLSSTDELSSVVSLSDSCGE